jgi:integrase
LDVLRALKTFLKWAVRRQLIPASPIANLPIPSKTFERDRLLSDDEVVRIYNAAAELDNFALVPRRSDYLFPTATGRPFCAWGKNKIKLDKLCGVDNFVLHDLRRYLSSTMRRLHVPIDVTETILNHVTGSRSHIQRIYDRHDRLPEMRAALELYEKHLAAIISSH